MGARVVGWGMDTVCKDRLGGGGGGGLRARSGHDKVKSMVCSTAPEHKEHRIRTGFRA